MFNFSDVELGTVSADKKVNLSLYNIKTIEEWLAFICKALANFPNEKFFGSYFISDFKEDQNLDVFVKWYVNYNDHDIMKIHFYNVIVFEKDNITDEILDIINSTDSISMLKK